MKIAAIGDPHGSVERIRKVPLGDVDLILLTGDLGSSNLMRKLAFANIERRNNGLEPIDLTPNQSKRSFMEAYSSSLKVVKYLVKFAPVYLIYGNVESSNAETRKYSKEIGLPLPFLTNALRNINHVRIINNRLANFNGVRIGGLKYFTDVNWVRDFKPSDYNKRMNSARKQTDKARRILKGFGDLDILVHHQPPYGFLDKVGKMAPAGWRGKNAGSKVILDYICKNQPKYTFCGHIHEGEGKRKIGKTAVYNLGVAGHKIIEV